MEKQEKLFLIIALLSVVILVYSPHLNYYYPFHVDEWHHIDKAIELSMGEYSFTSTSSLEIGYHLFLALLHELGFNLVLIYMFLPALFALFSAITLFLLVRYVANYSTALFTVIFFASLKSNVNILGLWFAVPLTFAIPFLFLSFLLLIKAIKEDKQAYFYFFALTVSFIFFIHPPTAIFSLIVSSLYFSYEMYKRKKLPKNFYKFLIIGGSAFLAIVFILIRISGEKISWFLSLLLFKKGWSPLELGIDVNPITLRIFDKVLLVSQNSPIALFGIIPFLLAVVGLYLSIKYKKTKLFAIWAVYAIFTILLFNIFEISPLVPNQRMLYYFLLGMTAMAGIGTERIFSFLNRKTTKKVAIIILLILFALTFYNYGEQRAGTEIYYLIDHNDYNALNYLKTISNKKVVLAPINIGSAVFPISYNFPVADLYFTGNDKSKNDAKLFFSSPCETKREIAKTYNVSYVYSQSAINCSFLKVEYSNRTFLYKVIG